MRKMIINADDLGISEQVNNEIEKGINLGVITSSSLIANAPAFEDGVQVAYKNPHISVGVHLNIIEFAPLTNREVFKKYGLVNDVGCFVEGAAFVIKYNEELKNAVYEEWDAQITKIERTGLVPTHCDSHEHTHTITDLKEVLCRVLKAHNITRVRRKGVPSIRIMLQERRHPTVVLNKSNAIQPPKRNILYRRLHLFAVKWDCFKWNRWMSSHYKMTDCFYALSVFHKYHRIIHLGGSNGIIELMCHPGHKSFQCETDMLMNDSLSIIGDYSLVTYRDL